MLRNLLPALAVITAISGCATSKISTLQTASKPAVQVKVIAVEQGGGLLADAVGVELSNRGFTILSPASTGRLMARLNLTELEITRQDGLNKLFTEGVDAYLSVRAVGAYDIQVQSASARVSSTLNGEVIAGVTWQNGWGGMAGSIADRTMRKGLSEAASEIAESLATTLKR